jgi:hypothetical protein
VVPTTTEQKASSPSPVRSERHGRELRWDCGLIFGLIRLRSPTFIGVRINAAMQVADVNGIRRTIIQTSENRKVGGSGRARGPPLILHIQTSPGAAHADSDSCIERSAAYSNVATMHRLSLPQQVICQRISTLGPLLPLSREGLRDHGVVARGASVRQFRDVRGIVSHAQPSAAGGPEPKSGTAE